MASGGDNVAEQRVSDARLTEHVERPSRVVDERCGPTTVKRGTLEVELTRAR